MDANYCVVMDGNVDIIGLTEASGGSPPYTYELNVVMGDIPDGMSYRSAARM